MTKDEDRSNNGDKCEPKTAMSVVTNVVQLSIYAVDIAINQYSSFSGICIGLAVSLFVATELFSWLYYFPSTNLDYPSVPLTIFWHLLIGVIIFCLGFTLNHSNLPVTNYYFLIRVPLLFNQFSSFVNVYAMMQTPLLANKLPFINCKLVYS